MMMAREKEKSIMSKSVNKTILLGNVGKDPEIKSTNGGTLVASFTLATADRYKDKQGEWQEQTEWHNLVAYARGAEIIRDYVRKGSKLYVEGKIKTRSWEDKDTGKKVYRTEIIVGDISLLSSNDGNARQGSGDNHRSSQSKAGNRDEVEEFGDLGITDADVPF
jgi:single-strand DNA-binding protein